MSFPCVSPWTSRRTSALVLPQPLPLSRDRDWPPGMPDTVPCGAGGRAVKSRKSRRVSQPRRPVRAPLPSATSGLGLAGSGPAGLLGLLQQPAPDLVGDPGYHPLLPPGSATPPLQSPERFASLRGLSVSLGLTAASRALAQWWVGQELGGVQGQGRSHGVGRWVRSHCSWNRPIVRGACWLHPPTAPRHELWSREGCPCS